jgi:hypothetical protein
MTPATPITAMEGLTAVFRGHTSRLYVRHCRSPAEADCRLARKLTNEANRIRFELKHYNGE